MKPATSPAPGPRFTLRQSILYATTIVLTFFALAEVSLRLIGVQSGMRPQILLRRIDVDITFPFMRPDRDLMWSLRPGFRGAFMGKMVSVSKLGLRGPAPELPKPGRRQRVVCFGDSVTFGYGVADDETYPARLGQALARHDVDVVNAGVTGYSSHQVLRLAARVLPVIDADVATLCVGWNDSTLRPVDDREYERRLRETMTVDALLERSRIYSVIKGAYWRWTIRHLPSERTVQRVSLEQYAENLGEIVGLCQRLGVRPAFIELPHRRSASDSAVDWAYPDAFEKAAHRLNVPLLRVGILGLHAGTSDTENDFIDQLHLSVDGNRRLAGMLAAQLVEDGLVYPAGD